MLAADVMLNVACLRSISTVAGDNHVVRLRRGTSAKRCLDGCATFVGIDLSI